jgi:hypothetical protein
MRLLVLFTRNLSKSVTFLRQQIFTMHSKKANGGIGEIPLN